MADSLVAIEVVCALPGRQCLRKLRVPTGTTAREAIGLAMLQAEFPELDLDSCQLGIFGREVADGQFVRQGDRVEVYRALSNEPRERRRALASRGATMAGARPAPPGTKRSG